MLGDKNLKDLRQALSTSYGTDTQNLSVILSYTKTNKLITALYMVTDMIDKEEPIRQKLRTLGAGIISDIHSIHAHSHACGKIYEIMSFLDIAYAINIISEMNCNILRKEFSELNQSIKDSTDKVEVLNRQINLSEFFTRETPKDVSSKQASSPDVSIGHAKGHIITYNGQQSRTRIGVQKGSTLMKALSDRTAGMSFIGPSGNTLNNIAGANNFDLLKKERRNEIISLIRKNGGSATITDIKNSAQGALVSRSEKTLQRELMSMIKDDVLNKTGEKRWSRYSIRA